MGLASKGLYSSGGKRWRSQVPLLRHNVQTALIVPAPGISQILLIYSHLTVGLRLPGLRINFRIDILRRHKKGETPFPLPLRNHYDF